MFEYPVKTNTPEKLLGAGNRVGTFPIGRLNSWHGGIHIESDDEHIRAIADGVIVAYRIPQDYTKEILTLQDPNDKTKTITEEALYSNAFVLIQHQFTTKNKQNLTFYSLYKHLWPASEMEDTFVSEIFQKALYTVDTESDAPKEFGTYIYSSESKASKVFVPFGAKLIVEPLLSDSEKSANHWTKKEKTEYKKVTYFSKNGSISYGYFLDTSRAMKIVLSTTKTLFINEDEDVCYQVTSDQDFVLKPGGKKGLNERSVPSAKTNISILHVIPKGTELELYPIPVKGNWYRIKMPDGWESQKKYDYITDKDNYTSGLIFVDPDKLRLECSGEISDGNAVSCYSIPVKAGTILGRAGLYGFEKHDSYRAAHIEVFAESETEVNSFLDDNTPDDPNPSRFFKIAKGKSLSNTITCAAKKGVPVKVLTIKDDYAQIEFVPITKTVDVNYLGPYNKQTNDYALTGLNTKTNQTANLTEVNNVFGGFLTSADTLVYIKKTEIAAKTTVKNGKKEVTPEQSLREVKYVPKFSGKKFWIESSSITSGAKAGDESSLSADISTAYFEHPADFKVYTYSKDAILETNQLLEHTDTSNDKYYYLPAGLKDIVNAQSNTNAGAIKETDGKMVSAYNWKEFGFNIVRDNESKYIYSCESPNGFLNDIWDEINKADANGVKDTKLDYFELRAAFNNIGIIRHLSRQICYHSNEWAAATDFSKLKTEVENLYKEGIKLEEDGARKNQLIKLKDEALKSLEARVNMLCWWDKVHVKPIPVPPPHKTSVPINTYMFGAEELPAKRPENCSGRFQCMVYYRYLSECPLEFAKLPEETKKLTITSLYLPQHKEIPKWCKYGYSFPAEEKPAVKSKTTAEKHITLKPFPANPKVFHFHPVAFVEQMKRMGGIWHDPLDNPQRNKYNSGGIVKPISSAFGDVRYNYTKFHSGLDLFALPGTPVYACLDGTIKLDNHKSPEAGLILRIKIKNTSDFINQMKLVNYKLTFSKGEEMGCDIKATDDVYLTYMHLSKSAIIGMKNKDIKAGQLIGYTGVSGRVANGIPSPHLHFEVSTIEEPYGTGKKNRLNPARVIILNSYDNVEQDESVKFKYFQDGTKKKR